MKINSLIKKSVILSLVLGFFSLSAVAMSCGTVPVFCVIKTDHIYNPDVDDYMPYYIAKKEAACVPTNFKLGYAAPLCKADIDEDEYFKKCKDMYPAKGDQRVVGLAYYKGGDPVNPANNNDTRMHGTFYNVVKIIDKNATGINIGGLKHFMRGCDIVV